MSFMRVTHIGLSRVPLLCDCVPYTATYQPTKRLILCFDCAAAAKATPFSHAASIHSNTGRPACCQILGMPVVGLA